MQVFVFHDYDNDFRVSSIIQAYYLQTTNFLVFSKFPVFKLTK